MAEQLRTAGRDVVAVVSLPDLVGWEDVGVARWARAHGRVVVTENVVDYAPMDLDEHDGFLLVSVRRWPHTRGDPGADVLLLHVCSEWAQCVRSAQAP